MASRADWGAFWQEWRKTGRWIWRYHLWSLLFCALGMGLDAWLYGPIDSAWEPHWPTWVVAGLGSLWGRYEAQAWASRR